HTLAPNQLNPCAYPHRSKSCRVQDPCLATLMWLLFTMLTVTVSAEEANEDALRRYSTAGAEAIQRNDYAGAEQAYRQLLALAPNLSEARSNLGLALYMQ